jgi:hypothetical protein
MSVGGNPENCAKLMISTRTIQFSCFYTRRALISQSTFTHLCKTRFKDRLYIENRAQHHTSARAIIWCLPPHSQEMPELPAAHKSSIQCIS